MTQLADIVVAVVDRDLVDVQGPEAVSYVHSQVSQRVDDMAVGESRWSFVLQPQGKLDGFFRVTRVGDDHLLLDTDPGQGTALLDSLARFKLRTKAEFAISTSSMLAFRGPGAAAAAKVAADGADVRAIVVAAWVGDEAVDVLGATGDALRAANITAAPISTDAFEALRVVNGLPVLGRDLDAGTIPNETGLVELSVSFNKGCYRGQELVERIHSRGGNRQTLGRISALDGSTLSTGAEIVAGERVVGSVTSAAGPSALGFVRGDVDPDDALTVDSVPVSVAPLFTAT